MKYTKRILSILMACAMLMMVMPMAVSAAGTQDDPIDAKTKWFGYGVDCYLLNPTLAEGNDGLWYTLTIEQEGILYLEHKYKDVDYTISVTVDGAVYEGGSVDGVIYNGPIMTLPLQTGDVATVQIMTKDAAAGTVYANMNVIAGDTDSPIKVKSAGIEVCVGAGQTVYFQDDTLNADYATKGLLVAGDVADTTFYTVSKNTESGSVVKKAVVDSDNDGVIEATLGGSLGSAGAPPVKPAWAIENHSAKDQTYTLTIVDDAHECVYDDDADTDCNTCGAEREIAPLINSVGASISKDVDGLAICFKANVAGMGINGTTAIYDNATIDGKKLVRLGAVVSNNSAELGYVATLDDVDGLRAVDVPVVYLWNINEEDGTVSFAIRVTNIPDEYKDREVDFNAYYIYEDESGEQHVTYVDSVSASYNAVAE